MSVATCGSAFSFHSGHAKVQAKAGAVLAKDTDVALERVAGHRDWAYRFDLAPFPGLRTDPAPAETTRGPVIDGGINFNLPLAALLAPERGVDVVPCGTCLEHFGVTPAVGSVSSMDDIVAALDRAAKVITL